MSFFKSSQAVSTAIGAAMVASNSGLSLFDRPLDRQNRDVVCTYLNELPHRIVAVWIAARPVNGMSDGYTFEHWCLKIQAPPSLISIDFLESDGRGKFGLSVTTAMEAELQDFLMYYIQDPQNGRRRKKWRIVSSVTPSPLINNNYRPDFLDPHELSTLKKYMKAIKQKSKNPNYSQPNEIILKKIKTNKKVCDIADFLEMWTEYEDNHKKKDKPYNAVSHNCQQFALHLFQYLIGNAYPNKVLQASKQAQSPADIKAHKIESKKNEDEIDNKHKKNQKKKIHVIMNNGNSNAANFNNGANYNNGALKESDEPIEEEEEQKTQ